MRRVAAVALISLALGGTTGYFVGRRAHPDPSRGRDPEARRPSSPPPRVESGGERSDSPPTPEDEARFAVEPDRLLCLMARLREEIGTERGAETAAALGLIRDPAVEGLALDLVRSGNLANQVAGLDLLDRLDIENPESRSLVLEMLRTDPRPEILSAALYALHRGVPSPLETRETLAVLAPLAAHPNVEVRRRSVIALAEWGALEAATAALRDPSPDVRAGAAFALGRFASAVDALAARVADEGEDWAVREQAWRSLARLPLDERTHAIYSRFRERHEAAGEASENR